MDTLNGQLAVASVFITFILCYIFAYLKGKTRKQKFAEKAKAKGYVTDGICVKSRTLRSYDVDDLINQKTTRVLTYSYHVDSKEYKKKLSYFSPNDMDPFESVTIN